MNPQYIVVQAGGKGTRLKQLTKNKPKALVPIENLPILFHLFRKYPDSQYVIIGDYKYDVLKKYLAAFADVRYELVNASGHKGTCAGLREAMDKLPENQPFMLIWSDLILPEDFNLPTETGNYIGVAKDFPCRWKYENNVFVEEASDTFGVSGLFTFENKNMLANIPEEGELVRWIAGTGMRFDSLPLYGVKEYGLLSEYKKLETSRCRPFNRIYKENGLFVKEAIDVQGETLANREIAWYKTVQEYHFENIPHIVSYKPLKMEYISSGAIYECTSLTCNEKKELLKRIIDSLKSLQALKDVSADRESYIDAYIGKTFERLKKVQDLVPFADDEYITVNERKCRNVFFYRKDLEEAVEKYLPCRFKLIHGDCTFSNMMRREDGSPVLIDPRGYFGYTELYGDAAYDWAKLYYSIVGNYDKFNRKCFKLDIGENNVTLHIESNGWEDLEPEFFQLLKGEVTPAQIHLLHSIIWLSLTTYAWEDYDSICGAFYNGLYYLEEALNEDIL